MRSGFPMNSLKDKVALITGGTSGMGAIASDAGDPKLAKASVDHVSKKYGRIDILFVNAGIARIAPLAAADEAQFDELFRVNNTPISLKMGLSPEQIAGFEQMAASGPLGRAGEPEEIAMAALYYAADGSRFTTGTELRIDGGISAV
jgi:NAD(P)-dependent dehydrogenase (short-subunit alcohol dehydrogenase family)